MKNSQSKIVFLIFWTLITTLLIFGSCIVEAGQTGIKIQRLSTKSRRAFIGEHIRLEVVVETGFERITGASFFLTFDSKIFRPILDANYRPFKAGPFLGTSASTFNGTHQDSLHLDEDANGIPGFQLDYYQSTGAASESGVRPSVQGAGTIATFELEVIGFTKNATDSSEIRFDFDERNARNSVYFLLGQPGTEQDYAWAEGIKFSTAGFYISPPIPDRLIESGDSTQYFLADYIQTTNDTLGFTWSYSIVDSLDNVEIDLDKTTHELVVRSEPEAHGILQLRLTAVQEVTNYSNSQNIKIGVNKRPYFNNPLPIIEFDEDMIHTVPKSYLFNDPDDSLQNVTLHTEAYNVFVENKADSLIFSARENWNGTEVLQCRLQDELLTQFGQSVDTTLTVHVLPVNDDPILDLSSEDPTTVYYNEPVTIPMITGIHVFDVDDVSFTFDVINPDTTILKAFFNGYSLNLENKNDTLNVDLDIIVTVHDMSGGSDTDTMTVQVREKITLPPVILDLPFVYKYPDSIAILDLDQYVEDEDTPKNELMWDFRVVDPYSLLPDTNITTDYAHEIQRVTFDATPGLHKIDLIQATVTDDAFNTDSDDTYLLVFGRMAPLIVPFYEIVMVTDTTIHPFDVDTMAYDLTDNPNDLHWQIVGTHHLQQLTINDSTHVMTITSNDTWLGVDTVTVVATNSLFNSDSARVIIRVVPRTPNPILIPLPDARFFWKEPLPQIYLDLDAYVFDLVTPDSSLNWEIDYDSPLANIVMGKDHIVKVYTFDQTGQIPVKFTVTDEDNYQTVENVVFSIIEDDGPVWKNLGSVVLPKTMALTLYDLHTKVTDDRTPTSSLKFGYETETPSKLNITIDPEVVISLRDTTFLGTTWMRFSATDGHGHTTWSNVINVITGKSKPPLWQQIPTIQFENNEIYRDLYLRDYCEDPEKQNLYFYATNSYPNKLSVQIIDSTSQVYLGSVHGYFGKLDVVFKAMDPDSNVISTVVDVIITDTDPPDGNLTYHYNPIASRHINFIVSSDATTTDFTSQFIVNNAVEPLSFKLIDSNYYQKIWSAGYQFTQPGNYSLTVGLANASGMINSDSLQWTIRFDALAKQSIRSADQHLVVETTKPKNSQNYFMLIESKLKQPSKRTLLSSKYSLLTNGESDGLCVVTYTNEKALDIYHGFYKISEELLEPLETFRDQQGNFQTAVPANESIVFGASDVPAHDYALPRNELLCYPNPFNQSIRVKFFVSDVGPITFTVFNILGQQVYKQQLANLNGGFHSIIWKGLTNNGRVLPSGVYFFRIQSENVKLLQRKVTLLK
ncbi:T9SS type A sorting domain-containing protein [candidate division KSB1 bacterium]|nr:T9SS type A sorting domain-containing protein [candidate division KSB1 bacterium]